jgi:hypothetical protein
MKCHGDDITGFTLMADDTALVTISKDKSMKVIYFQKLNISGGIPPIVGTRIKVVMILCQVRNLCLIPRITNTRAF